MASTAPNIAIGVGSSLDRFFTETSAPRANRIALTGLRGEMLAFQVVYRSSVKGRVEIALSGPAAEWATVRRIDLAHVEHPTYYVPKEDLIGRAPGFYPDPLVPETDYPTFPEQTRGAWVTVAVPRDAAAGRRYVVVQVRSQGRIVGRLRATVDVVGVELPPQRLLVIHWFHNDCLMSHYGFEAWSAEHWRMAERYLRDAAEHGVNTITTPVFTPPLDTAVGTERPTVQLVGVAVKGKDTYAFDFGRLGRWMDLCRWCGMTHFEISHLSTQWGARFAPKVEANVGGTARRIFGWEDSSTGPRYRRFLLQFLPRLVRFLKDRNALDRSFLHVSDEPHLNHLDQYLAVRDILRQGAPELPVLDALSNLEFYQHGAVDIPCPATDHAQPFLDAGVKPLWCYYCCGQRTKVSNRFMDFPSARNRILGWQLHKFRFDGFLQWGYNHWYDRLSDVLIDPYTNSHAGRPLPPGDGFVVYPGKDGPVDALRWEVFREGLQDMRAIGLLETLAGERPSPSCRRLLALRSVRSLDDYPRSPAWIIRTRAQVNTEIARLVRGGSAKGGTA